MGWREQGERRTGRKDRWCGKTWQTKETLYTGFTWLIGKWKTWGGMRAWDSSTEHLAKEKLYLPHSQSNWVPVINTKRSNYLYQQLGDSCYCSFSSHSISKHDLDYCFCCSSWFATSHLTFCGRRLIILCLPWQRRELVQLEEHNELDASNCACMGVSWESSAPDSVELRHSRLGWLVQAVHFWLVWATKLKCAFCATCPQIWHAIEISLPLFLSHANEQQCFSTTTDHFSCMQPSLINANGPKTLLSDYGSQAWEGPLIPLMSHKRRKIIHSNSPDIGWYFNIWPLTLGVYLPTELAHAQIPSDMHLHK